MSVLSKTCDPQKAEKLERIKRWAGIRRKWEGRKVCIYSTEHRAYWRPNGSGYTAIESEAGVYDFHDALRRTQHCDSSKGIHFYLSNEKLSDGGK